MIKKLSQYILFWEALLGIIWIAIILMVNPLGEFPLNDDWAYSKSVLHLVNTGKFILIDWPAMSLFAQVYWGGLWGTIFGFSFTILRISTLVLGFVGILVLFKLLYKTSGNLIVAFTGALLLMINPLYVSLSFTFMTDVPFTVFCILSVYSFYHYFKYEKITTLALALIFSVIATLTRQMGILVPLSFAIVYIVADKISVRSVVKAITPFIISVSSLVYYNHWLASTNRMTQAYLIHGNIKALLVQFAQPIGDTLYLIFLRAGAAFFYSTIFLTPLLIVIAPFILKKQKPFKKAVPMWMAGTFMFIYFLIFKRNIFTPLPGNVLYNLGMGPKLLKDSYILNLNITPFLDSSFWLVFSIIGLISMFFLMLALSDILVTLIHKIYIKKLDLKWKTIFFIYVVSFIYLGFLVFSYFFDRYFIFLIPTIIFVLLSNYGNKIELKTKWIVSASVFSFLLISWFAISATHDYLSWNRARWNALNYLTKDKKISPGQIDGGFEFNCWYQTGWWRPFDDSISWWFVNNDEYIISFGKIARYKTLKKFHYPSMLPCNNNNIYILQKNNLAPETITCNLEQFTEDKKHFVTSGKKYQIPVNNTLSTEKSYSGKYSIKLTPKDANTIEFALKQIVAGELVEIQIWKLGEKDDLKIVASGWGNNKFSISSNKINSQTTDGWERVSLRFYVPMTIKDSISICLMYTKQKSVYVDDLMVKVYHMD